MTRSLIVLLVLCAALSAQVAVQTGPYASAGGNQHKHVVRGPAGTLYMLLVSQDASGNRPLMLQASSDGGATWAPLTVAINDAMTGMSGANLTNGCCMAIDGTGQLHIVWGSYYYPTYYQQYYRQYDPLTGTLSATVNLSTLVGASTTNRTSAMNIAVDSQDTIWIAAQGTTNWRTRLLRSDQPLAANLAFTDLGPCSVSASAQTVRLAIDDMDRVHASYYRNTGSGEYWHRIYDPAAGGWQSSTRLGNTAPTNDFYGMLAADTLGFVHALIGEDLGSTTTWNFQYRRWDAVGGWGPPIPVFSATTAQYSGVANYRITALGCDEATGKVSIIFRDLANGGQLELIEKDVTATGFTALGPLTPPDPGQHAYYLPAIRGAMWPPFNRTGADLDVSWRQVPPPGPYQLVFQRISSGAGPASLALAAPAVVGQSTILNLASPADPNLAFFCGFSTGDTPGTTLANGQYVPLNQDWLLELSLVPSNGIFFNNLSLFDGAGLAAVIIAVPNVPALSGATIYGAFVVEAPGATTWMLGTISPSLAITIQ